LVHTLSKTASKHGYNLLTFSAFTIYGSDTKNAAGEYNILHLIPYEQLDALIVCHDTFNSNEAVEELWKLVTERCQAPIISIRKKVNGCYNILVEDTDAIPAFVRHFHDVHHFDRIAFMSGPYNHPDAIFRLEKYKEAMAELGLDCPEEYIFEGNFWKDCALDASKHLYEFKKTSSSNCLRQRLHGTLSFAKNLHYRVIQCHRISPFPVLMMCGMRVQMYHR